MGNYNIPLQKRHTQEIRARASNAGKRVDVPSDDESWGIIYLVTNRIFSENQKISLYLL